MSVDFPEPRMDPSDAEGERLERCLSRTLDGTASDAEWLALQGAAATDPRWWEQLAQTVRTEARVRRELEDELAEVSWEKTDLSRVAPPRPLRITRWSRAAGWAAALLFAALWLTDPGGPASRERPAPAERSGIAADAGTASALREASVSVLQELPRVVLETRRLGDGDEVEIVYLRRAIERTVTDRVFQMGVDDQGRPSTIPMKPAQLAALESF